MIKTAATLIASSALIAAGIIIIWLDVRKQRRRAFVSRPPTSLEADPELEITISHGADTARALLHADAPPAHLSPPPARPRGVGVDRSARWEGSAQPTLEQQWAALQPAIAAAVDATNAVLAPARLSIDVSDNPSWSYGSRRYGAHRRLLLDGESLGWLGLELTDEGRLRAATKAHMNEQAMLNTAAEAPAEGLTAARASDLLSRCLAPAVAYASRQTPTRRAEAGEDARVSIDSVVASALRATNGALAQTGAQLVAVAPAAWVQGHGRRRMTLSIEVNGDDVARMHIDQLPHEVEVAVGVRDPHFADLGRRRLIPVAGMTTHGLAELIASCAWPAIARFRDNRPQA